MSTETSPLLPQNQSHTTPKPQDYQIFLRICHATWYSVGSKTLLVSRAAIMAYMTVVWAVALHQIITSDHDARLFPFYLGTISYTFQIVYFAMASFWSMQHFVSPRNRPQRDRDSGIVGQVLSAHQRAFSILSIPRTTEFTSAKRLAFSVFYSAAQTYPFVITFLHYCVLGEQDGPFVTGNTMLDWISFSIFAANSGTALLESFVLSSVRKLQPFVEHCLALTTITGLYFAWARLGHAITGTWTYTQVDPDEQGAMGIFVNVVTSMALTMGMFLVVMGVHQLRDHAARVTGLGKTR